MLAEEVMVRDVVVADKDEAIGEVLQRMRQKKLRMLPVVDASGAVLGVFSTFSLLSHIVPDYIVSGDLESLSYAPDIGILHKHYTEQAGQAVSSVMDVEPICVHLHDSLLSVSAVVVARARYEYVLVVNEQRQLQGIISAGDVLDVLHGLKMGGHDDA